MARYRILYDRKNCISVGSCAAVAEKFWIMNKQDGRADLVGSVEKGEVFERWIDEKDLPANKEAARACPAMVITIFDEEGKQVSE